MRFLSNFECKIILICSDDFWHQQDCNSLFKGSIGHLSSQCKWPILGVLNNYEKSRYSLCTASGYTFAWFGKSRKMMVPSPVGDVKIMSPISTFVKQCAFLCSRLLVLRLFFFFVPCFFPPLSVEPSQLLLWASCVSSLEATNFLSLFASSFLQIQLFLESKVSSWTGLDQTM